MRPTIPKKESSYGSAKIDHFSPEFPPNSKSINLALSFEEGLKLQIALQSILLDLNSYNRSTTAGKMSAINLCIHTPSKSITVNPEKLKKAAPKKKK